jgi:uncharacterized RDD family membrane protein YckC
VIDPGRDYAGLVTRAVAFAIDVALVDLAAAIVAIVVGLGISAFDIPDVVRTVAIVVGGVAFVAWWIGYFTFFWSTTGQTPGARAMGIRVVCEGGGAVRVGSAMVRLVGMALAAVPFFAGFLMILVERRRRGLQDVIARTLVVYVPS